MIAGFSLLEIMITVALIGIIGIFAAPQLESYKQNARLRSSARDIFNHLQSAKLEAAKRNECSGVVFTTVTFPAEGGTYSVFMDNGNGAGTACDGVQHADEPVLTSPAQLSVESGVSLFKADNIGGTSGVIMKPNGVIRGSQSGEIQLRTTDRLYRITASSAGGFAMELSDDNGTTWRN